MFYEQAVYERVAETVKVLFELGGLPIQTLRFNVEARQSLSPSLETKSQLTGIKRRDFIVQRTRDERGQDGF